MPIIAAQPYEYSFPAGKIALIVIDMQRDFVEEGGFGSVLGNDVRPLARIVPTVRRLIDGFRAARLPIIHTREGHKRDLSDCPPAKRARGRGKLTIGDEGPMGRILVDGEPGNDLVPELAAHLGETVIVKPGKGAFYATPLDDILKRDGIGHLVFAGVTTEVCVQTTMREANDRLRVPAGRGRDRKLLPGVQGSDARHDPRPGRHRRLDGRHRHHPDIAEMSDHSAP